MKHKFTFNKQDSSSTGYAPTIQSTTGTYCVTQSSSRTSVQHYSESLSSNE